MEILNSEMREVSPVIPEKCEDGMWLVEGVKITSTSLFDQRLYYQEANGVWTRPKGGGSWNSIDG